MIESRLAEIYSRLPASELLRIQKTLKVILRAGFDARKQSRLIRESYRRLGRPLDVLEDLGLSASFEKLLAGFGVLSATQMSGEEQAELGRNPYTVWPREDVCMVSTEALEFLAEDSGVRRENYLYIELLRMPVPERRAWSRWLRLNCPVRSEKERTHRLYKHLGELRAGGQESVPEQLPAYLDEVFPDDPARSQLAWFYRDVLPLYRCLAEEEKKLSARSLKARVTRLLKQGRIIARAESPEFGERARYRLVATREQRLRRLPARETLDVDQRQEVLF